MKKFLNIVLTVLLLAGCSAEESAAQSDKKNCSMKVATYNLRMDTEKDGQNAWPNRKELVKELIVKYDFDIHDYINLDILREVYPERITASK